MEMDLIILILMLTVLILLLILEHSSKKRLYFLENELKKREDIINSIIKYDPQMSVYRQELLKKEISELLKIHSAFKK